MEEQKSLFEFNVDDAAAREMTEMSRWSKMFGIIILCLAGVSVLFLLFAWNKLITAFSEQTTGDTSIMAGAMSVVVVIVIAIVGIMMFFLIRSANRIRGGLFAKDQLLFNSGLNDLKTYFIFMGVFGILSLLGSLSALF